MYVSHDACRSYDLTTLKTKVRVDRMLQTVASMLGEDSVAIAEEAIIALFSKVTMEKVLQSKQAISRVVNIRSLLGKVRITVNPQVSVDVGPRGKEKVGNYRVEQLYITVKLCSQGTRDMTFNANISKLLIDRALLSQ